jgi:hypothetical protein
MPSRMQKEGLCSRVSLTPASERLQNDLPARARIQQTPTGTNDSNHCCICLVMKLRLQLSQFEDVDRFLQIRYGIPLCSAD